MDRSSPHDLERASAELGLLRIVVDRMPAMIAYWGNDQRCRFANRAYEKWFAVDPEALVGRTLEDLLGPIYQLNLHYIEGALRGEEQVFEREIPDPAGGPPRQSEAHYLPDVVDGEVRGFCVLVVDITRRKSAEAAVAALGRKLELVERLSALGTLAAGVGHEINNPLAIVMASVELALDHVRARAENDALGSEVHALEAALHGATRVRDVVRSMTLLAPAEESPAASVDVVACLESAIAASANVLRYRGRLVCNFRPVGKVVADSGQLTQVFVNLLMNAAQALREDRAAQNEIRVSTRSEGSETVIEIHDNGEGIPESLIGRIFEPFFTTKEVGAGMGLGLSVSHGTIHALGGSLTVESRVGEGSRFFVRLPSWHPDPASPSPPVANGSHG